MKTQAAVFYLMIFFSVCVIVKCILSCIPQLLQPIFFFYPSGSVLYWLGKPIVPVTVFVILSLSLQ